MFFTLLISGESWQEKIRAVRGAMHKLNAELLVVTALDEVACEYDSHPGISHFCKIST